jgi:ketosteroid isomerase-like protein
MITISDLRSAIEGRSAQSLSAFYTDDAVMKIIDRDNPPSRPRELKGRAAIAAYYDDVCSRAMTHKVESGVAEGDWLAFTQACSYPDGTRVFCSAMIELRGGKIARQTNLQAWDA